MDIATGIHRKHPQFATIASVWYGSSGLLGYDLISRKPEFVLGGLDHIFACPSRPGPSRSSKSLSFDRFVPWSPSLGESIQAVHQASFLNLQTSVNRASGGASVTAGLTRIAGRTQARRYADHSAPILQLPRRMSVPVQLLPAAAQRPSVAAEAEWSAGGVSVIEEHLAPSPAESGDADKLTLASVEALSQLARATAANGLKWVPLKVPWVPMP